MKVFGLLAEALEVRAGSRTISLSQQREALVKLPCHKGPEAAEA